MEDNYLNRPLIEDVVYEISDTRISIQSPCTCYVSYTLPCRLDKAALLRQYRNVLAMAKTQGTKISYTRHISRTIRALWPEYEAACAEREKLFGRLKELALLVRERGIHFGTVDDEVLPLAETVRGQLAAYGNYGNAVSSIAGIGYDLSRLERELSHTSEPYDMIAL